MKLALIELFLAKPWLIYISFGLMSAFIWLVISFLDNARKKEDPFE